MKHSDLVTSLAGKSENISKVPVIIAQEGNRNRRQIMQRQFYFCQRTGKAALSHHGASSGDVGHNQSVTINLLRQADLGEEQCI